MEDELDWRQADKWCGEATGCSLPDAAGLVAALRDAKPPARNAVATTALVGDGPSAWDAWAGERLLGGRCPLQMAAAVMSRFSAAQALGRPEMTQVPLPCRAPPPVPW